MLAARFFHCCIEAVAACAVERINLIQRALETIQGTRECLAVERYSARFESKLAKLRVRGQPVRIGSEWRSGFQISARITPRVERGHHAHDLRTGILEKVT